MDVLNLQPGDNIVLTGGPINGQTGRIAGDLPMDKGLFWKYMLTVSGAVAALAFACSYCMWL